MSYILKSACGDDTYPELTKVSLKELWDSLPSARESYQIYSGMIYFLRDTNTVHQFFWNDTGNYFPDSVWIDISSESATYFKLKYNI